MLERENNSVKRPAAWLRKAIEDGYTAPDGYVSLVERERQANEEKRRKKATSAAQKAHSERTEQQQKAQNEQRMATLNRFHTQYGTGESELAIWKATQEELTYQGVSAAITSSLHLLKIENEKVILYVSNDFVQRLIKPDVRKQIEKTLSETLKRSVTVAMVTQTQEGDLQ
ncbi:MAG: hypothetical protein R2867_37585 [Caldilineaceae bacterium]